MKSRREIWQRALEELSAQCSVSTARDLKTVTDRVSREGDSFFTVTLPRFGRDFERSLAHRSIPEGLFIGFKRRALTLNVQSQEGMTLWSTESPYGVPLFLGGFLDLVFDSVVWVDSSIVPFEALSFKAPMKTFTHQNEGPRSLEDASDAIAAVRQLCLMFGKEKERAAPAQVDAAVKSFVATDRELDNPLADGRATILFEGHRLARTRQVIRIMFGDSLAIVDKAIYDGTLEPGHGPGKTADRLEGNQKWTLPTWHDRLETLFPYGDYGIPSVRYISRYSGVKFLGPQEEPPAKLVDVPKTPLVPRLIVIEPTVMQYIQQGISRLLVQNLERYSLSRDFVGFTQQWPNQAMAQIGSEDGSLATLDLSEASDRMANWLVEDLFADFPWFLEGIQACRSQRCRLPSGEVIPLLKFASMGSALTFPLETMLFAAIAVERVLDALDTPIRADSIMSLRDKVRAYGDDIIVPTGTAESVIGGLETLGFKVNKHKSFWTGEFRESCGKEYWNGFDVSIVKFRTKLPSSPRDAAECVSTVSTRNQLFKAGLKKTAYLLDGVLDVALRGHYPYVAETSPVLGKIRDDNSYEIHTVSDDGTFRPRVKGWQVRTKIPANGIDDLHALLKCFSGFIGMQNPITDHLRRSGRPLDVSINLGNGSPF